MTQLEDQVELMEYNIMSSQEKILVLMELENEKSKLISSDSCTQQDIDELDYHINHIKKLLSE